MSLTGRAPEPWGILLIHGAAVVMEQRALVFLGPSGAGKSTISKVLEPFAPVIGDDRLYLIPQGTDWLVANATTTRSLRGPLTEEEARTLTGFPLGAVFRLIQSPESHVAPVDATRTCRHLCSAFYEFGWASDFDPEVQKAAFATIAAISRKAPGFDLHFCMSTEIVDEIRNIIRNQTANKSSTPEHSLAQEPSEIYYRTRMKWVCFI